MTTLDFNRLTCLQRITGFNPQITNYTLNFFMAQQELDHTKLLDFLVD